MYKKLALGVLLSSKALIADDSIDIDSMLLTMEKKSDLSEKTKLENSGISFVYTRSDLERMQVHYLKDLLKKENGFSYNENKYGLPDPMTNGDAIPYMSSLIKVYVDNQEITAGMYGSGLIIFGDINMGFVDHVEIYTYAPTYEFSTEPTVTLIKLYSKTAQRDEGSKITLDYDSNNASKIGFYNTAPINDEWSYFTYASFVDDKRKKVTYNDNDLSRDKTRKHILATLSSKNHHILFNATQSNQDAFIGLSLDATPEENSLKSDSIHLGYDTKVENFSFLLSYDYLKTDHKFSDDVTPLEAFGNLYPIASRDVISKTNVFTAEAKYRINFAQNHLVIGLKGRGKWYKYPTYTLNGIDMPEKENTNQKVLSGFVEDQYSILDNLILNAGFQYMDVKNPDARHNEHYTPMEYRYGITYLKGGFIAKFIGSYAESYLEPYIIDSSMLVDKEVPGYKQHNLYINFSYLADSVKYDFILGRSVTKDYLFPLVSGVDAGKLDAYDKSFNGDNVVARMTYEYREFDKLLVELSYVNIDDIPTEKYETAKAVVRSLNRYKKLDFFNELIIDRAYDGKRYYDISTGVSYDANDDIKISIKAENILDKAKETTYYIQNTTYPYAIDGSLYAPLYDRKVNLSVEYLF